MSVLFHPRRGPAVLGATAVLLVITLVSTGFSRPATDRAPAPDSRSLAVAEARKAHDDARRGAAPVARAETNDPGPSWLAFGLAAGGALLLGAVAGAATTAAVRPRSAAVSP